MNGQDAVEHWAQVDRLLDRVLALPITDRAAFVQQQTTDDPRLRDEVLALLAEFETRGDLLDRPAADALSRRAPALDLQPGHRIGAYRVLALLGRGGMGEVYRAERADGQFEHQIALKLLRQDAVEHLGLFVSERRILARLEHPGIARLYDAGVGDDGRPYMVMELVEGIPIIDWCRQRKVNLADRLALFAQVCDAVAYAHQNLVIHRDLKPGNILVTNEGRAKLLDFGVAKLLSGAVEEATRNTPLTLSYAAPEQLTHTAVSTATDIYALGVLLFELLTERLPWMTGQIPVAVAIDKVLYETAPKPGAIAGGMELPPVPARLLSGDLDAIVGKALRKEPADRYATVVGLQADVRRHVQGEPVVAREGARLYVFGRFMRRYRWAVAGVAVLIVTLAGGLAGTAWQARRAQSQAARATAMLDFVEGLFEGADPAKTKGESITARELLDRGATRVDSEFAQQTELRAQLKHTIGQLYLKLGLLDRARDQLGAALALTPRTGAGSEERFTRLVDRARVDLAVGTAEAGLARLDEAATLATQVPERAGAETVLAGLRAKLLRQRGDDVQALDAAGRAYASAKIAFGSDSPTALDAAEAYAELLGEAGRNREALPLMEHIAEAREMTLGRDDPQTLHALWMLAGILQDVDQAPRAMILAQDVLERRRRVLGDAHPETAWSLFQVGSLLYEAGRYREADVPLAQAIALLRKLDPTDRSLLAMALHEKATSAYDQDRLDEAEQGYRQSDAMWSAVYGPNHREALRAQMALAHVLRRKGRQEEAIAVLRHVDDVRAAVGGDTPERFEALRSLGDALSAKGEHAEAIKRLVEAEQMALRLYGEQHENPQQTRVLLGRAYLNAGDAKKAAEITSRALAALQALHPQGHPDVARTQGYLARIELQLGHHDRAVDLARRQYDFVRAQFAEADNPRVADAQGLLGECLLAAGRRNDGRHVLEGAVAVLARRQPDNAQLGDWRGLLESSR